MEILRAMKPHQNVVRLHYYAVQSNDSDEDSRLLSLFMDYLPSNLHCLIQDHVTGMPIELIRIYSKQLLSGLAHLASQNIVHRDLVPRNILIDPDQKTLKLADFGCAKVVNPEVPNHPHVGVWQYRAVELLFGATHYSSQAGTILLDFMAETRCMVSWGRHPRNGVWQISFCSIVRGCHVGEHSHNTWTDYNGTSARYASGSNAVSRVTGRVDV